MINKAQAMELKIGDIVEHTRLLATHASISLLRARVVTKCEINSRLPNYYRVHVIAIDFGAAENRSFDITALTGCYWNIVNKGKSRDPTSRTA